MKRKILTIIKCWISTKKILKFQDLLKLKKAGKNHRKVFLAIGDN